MIASYDFYIPLVAILLSLTLAIYLLVRQRTDLAAYALAGALIACGCSELFDLLAVTNPADLMTVKKGALIAEASQPFCFLLFSLTFARERALKGLSWFSKVLLAVTLVLPVFAGTVGLDKLFYSPDFAEERILFLDNQGYYFYILLMACLATALFHLERTLLALSRIERSRVKFEMVGVGAIMVILVVYYSQALFYRSVDMNLVLVRSLILALGVCMVVWSRVRGGAVTGVRVSPDMAYRSLVLLTVSIYLLGLGLLGEGMRYLDVLMHRAIFVSVAVLGGLIVVLVLLSEKLRRKAKVFLHKHFYQQKYEYRKEWLRFTRHLSSARSVEALQQGILSFYCDTFACEAACLYLRDDGQQNYQFVTGYQVVPLRKTFELNSPFISFLAERDWVFNVADDNPENLDGAVQFCEKYGFSLAVPLMFEKTLEGIIFIGQPLNPEEQLNYEDFDLMKMLARQVASTLRSVKLSAQLSTAKEMAAIGQVSAFVVHDLKNLVSSLSMVTCNAQEYLDDPEFQQDMLETLEYSTDKMKNLIARLQKITERRELHRVPTDLFRVVSEGVRLVGAEQVQLSGESVMTLLDAQEMEKVVQNLVLNALEAGGDPVSVEVGVQEEIYLRVSDQGCGMSEEFMRQRLFKPFQTTKAKGFGIGLYQCRNIVEAHGGRIEVESHIGEGTSFTVLLPLNGIG